MEKSATSFLINSDIKYSVHSLIWFYFLFSRNFSYQNLSEKFFKSQSVFYFFSDYDSSWATFSGARQLRKTNSGHQRKGFLDESFTRDEIKEMNFRKLSRIRSGFREMNSKIPKISIIIPGKMIPTVKITIFNRFYEIT